MADIKTFIDKESNEFFYILKKADEEGEGLLKFRLWRNPFQGFTGIGQFDANDTFQNLINPLLTAYLKEGKAFWFPLDAMPAWAKECYDRHPTNWLREKKFEGLSCIMVSERFLIDEVRISEQFIKDAKFEMSSE